MPAGGVCASHGCSANDVQAATNSASQQLQTAGPSQSRKPDEKPCLAPARSWRPCSGQGPDWRQTGLLGAVSPKLQRARGSLPRSHATSAAFHLVQTQSKSLWDGGPAQVTQARRTRSHTAIQPLQTGTAIRVGQRPDGIWEMPALPKHSSPTAADETR